MIITESASPLPYDKRQRKEKYMITLPKLTYAYNALEPFIDEQTMRIHHTKHHQAYIDKLNAVLEKYPSYQSKSVEYLLTNLETLEVDPKDRIALRNHGGGHVNHTFFWTLMGKNKEIDDVLSKRIQKKYGSIDAFKDIFSQTALSHFGSGWAWLVENKKKELDIYSTSNQDSPYLTHDKPLIALDIWEHAYYLLYQNRRAEYIKNWWNVLKIL